MKLSVLLFAAAAAGVLGGAWLIAVWAVGLALIVESAALAAFALFRDDGTPTRQPTVQTVEDVLERARRGP